MVQFANRAWLEVDLDRLRQNCETIRSRVGTSGILAVLKANAYGQGADVIGPALERFGVREFGVATADEGASLRRAGVTGRILVLGRTDPMETALLLAHDLTATLPDIENAAALDEAARNRGGTLSVELKLETGMTRLGFACDTAADRDRIAEVYRFGNLHPVGCFSHFASSDDPRDGAEAYCAMQLRRFLDALADLTARGLDPGVRHICNTGGAQKYPEARLDLVRCGIALAGYNTAYGVEPWPLRPISGLKTSVSTVREIPAGTCVGYGRTYTAPSARRIATIGIGYADGYPRALSNCGAVLIGGHRAPVVGNVCMDQMMVDITGIPAVCAGDPVTVIGTDGALTQTADDLAAQGNTCAHEILSRLSPRLQHLYFENGARIDLR